MTAAAPLLAGQPIEIKIATGDAELDRACDRAISTLRMNVSEKWGKLCPVLAPAWGTCYPAWIHAFDNFWMTKVTPYLFPKQQAEWPVILLSKYQWPTGMSEGGIHDVESPEGWQAFLAKKGPEWVRKASIDNPYLRDHLYIMQVHDLWWHYGDLELARSLFASCKKALDYVYTLKDEDRDGLVESANVLEDVFIGSEKESRPNAAERFVEQAMLYGALADYAKLAGALGEKTEAERARSRLTSLAREVNKLYWDEKGYYIFALDSKTHEPVQVETTSTYANGYAVLWGLAPPERAEKILDYLTSFEFEVPGPILVPPLQVSPTKTSGLLRFPPGVYVNGGCGWGRGHLPSVALALFAHGREDLAISYLRKMARAVNRDGAFYEYWTWEKYTGSTKPGGCRNYSETASAFLDSVIHGYFGVQALEPGWQSVRLAPNAAAPSSCSIALGLPGGDFSVRWTRSGRQWIAHVKSAVERNVELAPAGAVAQRVRASGDRVVQVAAEGSGPK